MPLLEKVLQKYRALPPVAKASGWFLLCTIIQKSVNLITTPIFTRLMSTEQYGLVTAYNSWFQIFAIFTTLKLNGAVFNKGMSRFKEDRDGYTATQQTVTLGLTIIVFILYLIFRPIINRYTELPTFIMVLMFLELAFMPAVDFWTIRNRYEYIFKPVVIRTLLMAFLNAFLGVMAVSLWEEKAYARILSIVFVNTLFGMVLFGINRKNSKTAFNPQYAKFALLFNLPLLLHYISHYILEQFDRIMIQRMVGLSAAGIYGVAYNMGLMLRIVTVSLNNSLVPWEYEQLEKKNFKGLNDVLFCIFMFVAGCGLAIAAFAPEIMAILATEKYCEGIYCIPPIALAMIFSFMYTTFANVEIYYDLNKFTMYISTAVAGVNIALNYVFIKLYGYQAAAYTTLACYMLFAAGHYIYMETKLRKRLNVAAVFDLKRILLLSTGAISLGLIFSAVYNHTIIRYFLILVLFAAAYWNRNKLLNTLSLVRKKRKKKE